jgi:hypothetical protein
MVKSNMGHHTSASVSTATAVKPGFYAQAIAKVLPERLEGIPSPHLPAPLLCRGYVPEPAQRGIVSLVERAINKFAAVSG